MTDRVKQLRASLVRRINDWHVQRGHTVVLMPQTMLALTIAIESTADNRDGYFAQLRELDLPVPDNDLVDVLSETVRHARAKHSEITQAINAYSEMFEFTPRARN